LSGKPSRPIARWIGATHALGLALLFTAGYIERASDGRARPPILDVHLHARRLAMYGAPPPAVCTNDQEIILPGLDPLTPLMHEAAKTCRRPVNAPTTDDELLRTTLKTLERFNITAVTTGPLEEVQWVATPGCGRNGRCLRGDQPTVPWAEPGVIEVPIESMESADFLTEEQKRDIFYHNAARFLRLRDTTPRGSHP
jgi:hypothetical protein